MAKLNEESVIKIREAARAGETISALSRQHGVDRRAIRLAVQRKTWRHVPEMAQQGQMDAPCPV